jgi:hypothetical protein
MAQQHQQQDHRAGLQHLAHLKQDSEHQQVALVPQHQQQQDLGLLRQAWQQQQEALVAVQDLERRRLQQRQQE